MNSISKRFILPDIAVNVDDINALVCTPENISSLNKLLSTVRDGLKNVSDQLLIKIKRPSDIIKSYREVAKRYSDPMEEARVAIGKKLLEFDRIKQEEKRKIEMAALSAKVDAVVNGVSPIIGEVLKAHVAPHIKTREIRDWHVVDVRKVPADILDKDVVKEAIIRVCRERLKAGRQVPGIVEVKRKVMG